MSEPVVVQPAPRKGMSTGAKIAIGCLIGVLLIIGACVVAGTLGLKWLGSKVEKYENDPDAAAYDAALFAFKMNPEFEVVASDSDAKTITVRNKQDGKEVTFNLEDIKSGNLTMESGGEKVRVGVDTEEGGEATGVTVESDEGRMVIGSGDANAVPEWVPAYPGARADGFSSLEANGEKSGTYTIHTDDSVAEVIAFYEEQLRSQGFEVEKATMNVQGADSANLTGTGGGRTVSVAVATQEGATQGIISYNQKP